MINGFNETNQTNQTNHTNQKNHTNQRNHRILGVDEAGRGPVIGPMVICGALVRKGDLSILKEIGVKDSKCLTRRRREVLAKELESILLDYHLIYISARKIDKEKLNYLELISAAELIKKFRPDEAIIDAPTPWCQSYRRSLQSLLKKTDKVYLRVENFADKNYFSVAAASILAKVARDREMTHLSEKYGPLGSGYPGDKKTVRFLEKCILEGQFPPIVRKRWKTLTRVSQAMMR